jgi:hypothetical protein
MERVTEADLADAAIAWAEAQQPFAAACTVTSFNTVKAILQIFDTKTKRIAAFATCVAREVLPFWESKHTDNRVRHTIESAEAWLENPSQDHAVAVSDAVNISHNAAFSYSRNYASNAALAAHFAARTVVVHAASIYREAWESAASLAANAAIRAAYADSWKLVQYMLSKHVNKWLAEDWIATVQKELE